jgi:hypothetical protein
MRPFLKNLCVFPSRQVAHYNKTTLKIFHFSPRQVAHYNKTTLKNLRIFHHLKNLFSPT